MATYTLTDEEVTDFQGDVGITDDESVFTDAELQRFFQRAEGSIAGSRVLALRQLLADKAKLHRYRTGLSEEFAGEVFDHIKGLLAVWQDALAGEKAGGGNQVTLARVRRAPEETRAEPRYYTG